MREEGSVSVQPGGVPIDHGVLLHFALNPNHYPKA